MIAEKCKNLHGLPKHLAKVLQLKISTLANTGTFMLMNVCCPYK